MVMAALPVATMWLILHLGEIGERAVRLGRRLRVLPAQRPRAWDPPLERTAADLRRLALAVRTIPHGTPNTRRRALQMAYEDTLVIACRALDLPHSLGELPAGIDRELERLRVETALEAAGLRFRPVAR